MIPLTSGLQAVFGAAFAALYADGVLHKVTLTDDGADGFTATTADSLVKVLAESLSDQEKAAGGLPRTALRLSVLRAGLPTAVTLDDNISVADATYRVIAVDTDPAGAAYKLVGVPA